MRYFDDISPAAPAGANRAQEDLQCSAACVSDSSKQRRDLQRLQADFLARRCGLDRDLAAALASLVFGEAGR